MRVELEASLSAVVVIDAPTLPCPPVQLTWSFVLMDPLVTGCGELPTVDHRRA